MDVAMVEAGMTAVVELDTVPNAVQGFGGLRGDDS